MGRRWYDSIIWVVFFCLLMLISCSVSFKDADSLGGFVHKYTNNSLSKPRTGVVYNITLPSKFSGIEVSYVRLMSISFWVSGENLSWISIPPRITPIPFVKRIAIVFENLGNWSSSLYQVPGYTLVAPVLGFTFYDSTSNSSTLTNRKLNLFFMGRKPILMRFPEVKLGEMDVKKNLQCVKFGDGGGFELKNMTKPRLCSVTDYGHFSLVVPNSSMEKKKKKKVWEWWVVGFGCVLVGLALVGLVLMAVLRLVRRKNIKDMEKVSDRGECFDTVWIGKSRLPSASMVRTQPTLENSYIP
ncbi:uncharacterized protein LOC111494479 [Cucurbita maxima]|uniref:Uncharacterized protein LOC111494479 n=1 Tax=Cucurbita maxima TaxID=3661 RepID=A0A6J1KJ68_CUCMA|nr:uncharacterized protein LOC111494479 [Cucurbita maxima]